MSRAQVKNNVGGLPFFISYLSLLYLALSNSFFLIGLINTDSLKSLLMFAAGLVIGALSAGSFILGRFSVFIHELEHSIVSNLVGNKSKDMEFDDDSGHFSYEYTHETAKYNALISLAPYYFPLFTLISVVLTLLWYLYTGESIVFILGIGLGIDLVTNLRDISPVQSDLTSITGGYYIALGFIACMNVSLISFLLAWVLAQVDGYNYLFSRQWSFMTQVVFYLRAWFESLPSQ